MSLSTATRNASFFSLDCLPESRACVYRVLDSYGACTDQEIAMYLAWPINRVTPRRGELVKAGLVVADGTTVSRYGKRVVRWKIKPATDENGQAALGI